MKLIHLTIATAAVALLGGAAYAQDSTTSAPNSAPSDSTTAAAPMPADPTVSGTTTTTDQGQGQAPASAAGTAGTDVSAGATFNNMTVTNGPVPDTAANRAKCGSPMSRAGKRSAAKGN
jgi:hypothetical protein